MPTGDFQFIVMEMPEARIMSFLFMKLVMKLYFWIKR